MSIEDVPLSAQSHGSARLFTRRGCLCSAPLRERAFLKKDRPNFLAKFGLCDQGIKSSASISGNRHHGNQLIWS